MVQDVQSAQTLHLEVGHVLHWIVAINGGFCPLGFPHEKDTVLEDGGVSNGHEGHNN